MAKSRKSAVRPKSTAKSGARPTPPARKARPVRLLAGGNPRIAKADGDAPVQAYIAAMPGWKREVGRRLDALIVRHVPAVRKAVKRCGAATAAARGQQERRHALSRHPRRRCAGRGADGEVAEAGGRVARLDPVDRSG